MNKTIDAMKQAKEELEAIWRLAAIGPDHLSKTGATHLFSARSLVEEAIAAEEANPPLSAERAALIKELRELKLSLSDRAADMLTADAGSTSDTECLKEVVKASMFISHANSGEDVIDYVERLAADAQKVEVPQGYALVPLEVKNLYGFMDTAFVAVTSQQDQIKISLELARGAMLNAAPKPTQADAPPQLQPMTDGEIRELDLPHLSPRNIVRAIEAHHGIGSAA